jgi:predicted GNAT family N-acyltransferase
MKMSELEISTDKARLDLDFVTDFISNTYWAKGRTKEAMQTCIDHSLNFGVYLQRKQIGYARVVTDFVQFAYLMDVFITEEHRGMGYSKKLMHLILDNDELKSVKMWRLASSNAQGLYSQFGFEPLAKPEVMMELIRK